MSTAVITAPYAALGMYPFPALAQAWDALYEVAAADVDGAPERLTHDLDPHDTWLDPNLAVGMTCGWPLVTALGDRVRVVGSFAYDVGGPASLYRTAIIAREDAPLTAFAGGRAAINSVDSLSGNISLLSAFDLGAMWDGEVVLTGAHLASIQAVRSGAADVASIDGMTWAFQQRDDPSSLDGLVVVGHGPYVPCLPVIVPADATDSQLDAWRAGFRAAVADPRVQADVRTLLIRTFVVLDLADYEGSLAPLLQRHAH